MVGKFGEVQVMDWGLAKVLSRDDDARPDEGTSESSTLIHTSPAQTPTELSQTGAAMGTPSYMPPEQALGERDVVDERADVFALGAMLCEELTGAPPYRGGQRDEVLRRARRGDLVEALLRLEGCGADRELVQLCRECLAAEWEIRPRHAGVVAERLAAYQADVQERLRRAEVERAAAQVQAREERKRRRLTLALAATVLLLLGSGGGFSWWRQRQQDQADLAVSHGLARAEVLAENAHAEPLQPDRYQQALEAARVAGRLADNASAEVRGRAEELIAHLEHEEEAAWKDRALLAALLDVRGPREGPQYRSDAKGSMLALAEPTADEQLASAFRRWGLDVDGTPTAEAAAQLRARPTAVVTEVIAALDEWASERCRQGQAKAAWQRLTELAAILDEQPGSRRRELRAILARGRLPLERTLGVLSAMLRPVPIPVEVPLGQDQMRLRQIVEQTDPAREPILGLLTLVRVLAVVGEETRAVQLLRAAIVARPQEVVLHHTLGQMLVSQQPPRWSEAVESYAAARTLRPALGVNLAVALRNSGRDGEGRDLLSRLVSETPTNPYLHFHLANALAENRQLDEALEEFWQTIALDPKDVQAHNNLGVALYHKKRSDEALAEFRQTIALDPKLAPAHNNFGVVLDARGRLDEALAEFRQAVALDPKLAQAHNNLRNALRSRGRLDEALAEYRQAIVLEPKNTLAHYNLGSALRDKGQLDEAVAEFRATIRTKPDFAESHCNLGQVLKRQGRFDEALASLRRGHELGSKKQGWRYPSAQWVRDAERLLVLDRKLPAILSGEESPLQPGEAVSLAWMCRQPYKKCYAASARLYAEAFTSEPALAADLNEQHRYHAACSAALAGGQVQDARLLPHKAAAMFRRWALTWLRHDLTAYAKLAERNSSALNKVIQQRLLHWRRDTELASLRDPHALDRLPDNELAAWQALWRDVDELAKRVTKRDKTKVAPDSDK